MSYTKALQSSQKHIVETLREVKNIDKIEESEIEKCTKNIVIHGTKEVGNDAESIKNEDEQYVKTILTKLGINGQPQSVLRLGKPNDRNMRPIKIVLENRADKSQAMMNLNRLKGTQDEFGNISITDDYTEVEREEIKIWVKKAKNLTAQDPDKIYKVRGTPKNGLKLIWFPKNK